MDKKRAWYKSTGTIVLILLIIFVLWFQFDSAEKTNSYDRKLELKEEVNSEGFDYIDGGNYSAENLGLDPTGYGEIAYLDIRTGKDYPESSDEEEDTVIKALLALDSIYNPDTYNVEINYNEEVKCTYYVPGHVHPVDYDISKESLVSLSYSESCEEIY